MNKFEQINKMAQAAALLEEVMRTAGSDFQVPLQSICDEIADLADEIESA